MKALALALALVPQGALALSCLAPDVAATYAEAVRSQDRYSVLLGRLTFDESLLPPAMNSSFTPPRPAPIEAHFSGAYLAGGDFVSGYDAPMSVIVECAGPWCGSPTDGAEYLLFARHGADGLVVTFGACAFWAFQSPTNDQIAAAQRANR